MMRRCLLRICATSGAETFGKEAIAAFEKEAKDKENRLNSRNVHFACGTSSDHRARYAGSEAFELAAAALPKPPNFAMTFVSMDNSTMMEAPEVIWGALKGSSGVPNTHMIGAAVKFQQVGKGHVQVLAGHIPDLEIDRFTLDSIPETLNAPERPPAFMGMVFSDAQLCLPRTHERLINQRLSEIHTSMPKVPIVGASLPHVSEKGGGEAIFFVDDTVYRSSAAAVLLRSKSVKAMAMAVTPSIDLGSVSLRGVSSVGEGRFAIERFGDEPAAEAIRRVYETSLTENQISKVFIGIKQGDGVLPLSFSAGPTSGSLEVLVPPSVEIAEGMEAVLVADDVELDMEFAMGGLLKSHEELAKDELYAMRSLTVHREGTSNILCSTRAAVHFSHPHLNQVARREGVLKIETGSAMQAPTVLHRAVGHHIPNTGAFVPSQILPTGSGPSTVMARSAVFATLCGLD